MQSDNQSGVTTKKTCCHGNFTSESKNLTSVLQNGEILCYRAETEKQLTGTDSNFDQLPKQQEKKK